MAELQREWMGLDEVAPLFGLQVNSLKNLINGGKFPVPAYKLARRWVIDKDVLAAYFADQKKRGLKQLKKGTK